MFKIYKQDGETIYGVKEYVVDSSEDIADLPTSVKPGSAALVIPTGEVYMLNCSKQWILVGGASSGGNNTVNCSCNELLNQLDADNDGIIDQAESVEMIEV